MHIPSKSSLIIGFTVFAILTAPTALLSEFILVEFKQPVDIPYTLWLAHINIFDLLLATIVIFDSFSRQKRPQRELGEFILLTALLAGGTLVQAITQSGSFFWDGVIFHLRLLLFFQFSHYIIARIDLIDFLKVFTLSVLILSIISIAAVALTGYRGVFGGRINFLGMGVNGTAEFCFIALAFILTNRKLVPQYYLAFCVPIFSIVALSGSRRVLILTIALIILTRKGRIALSLLSIAIIAISILTGTTSKFIESTKDEFASIGRIMDLLSGNSSLENEGRVGMYKGAIATLSENKAGIGVSDWLIQRNLQKHTTGSHTHNFFLQSYLKFGPFIILAIPFLARLIKNLPSIPTLNWIWISAFTSLLSGYGFWNYKYLLIYTILYIYTTEPSTRTLFNNEQNRNNWGQWLHRNKTHSQTPTKTKFA